MSGTKIQRRPSAEMRAIRDELLPLVPERKDSDAFTRKDPEAFSHWLDVVYSDDAARAAMALRPMIAGGEEEF